MIVCVCKNISEKQIRQATHQGVHTMRALSKKLGVGTQCGKCGSCANNILKQCNKELAASRQPIAKAS